MVRILSLSRKEVSLLREISVNQLRAIRYVQRKLARENLYVHESFVYEILKDSLGLLLLRNRKGVKNGKTKK